MTITQALNLIIENIDADKSRLSKYLAQKGICSRREADDWIKQSWITIDGKKASLGQLVHPNQAIHISAAAIAKQAQALTFLLHKPLGYVSGQPEDGHLPASNLLTLNNQCYTEEYNKKLPKVVNAKNLPGLAPAGRLDIDSTGLLVFTQDGRLAKHLIGENSNIEKEYLVRVVKDHSNQNTTIYSSSKIIEKLQFGLSLDGVPLKPAKAFWENKQRLRIILREGKKRQIRRMCQQVGLKVLSLKRIRIGKIYLKDLPIGKWRVLGNHESF